MPERRPLPPRKPLCRHCGGRGFVVAVRRADGSRTAVVTDACPFCARDAEDRWRAVQLRELTNNPTMKGAAA